MREGIKSILEGRPGFGRAVSIGCDTAEQELRLISERIINHFDLYELSETRAAAGLGKAMAVGVEDQVTFCVRDAFLRSEEGQYHLVYWDNSLHHMMDVDDALSWSKACLRPGDDSGTFNRLISCPTPDKIIALDPSVAAGSSRAIPALNKYFPGATISPTDGAIYRIGFAGLYGSMDMSDQYDRSVIDWTLLVGEVLMKQEMTHYTFAVCQV